MFEQNCEQEHFAGRLTEKLEFQKKVCEACRELGTGG
jgi:hypothetical protein